MHSYVSKFLTRDWLIKISFSYILFLIDASLLCNWKYLFNMIDKPWIVTKTYSLRRIYKKNKFKKSIFCRENREIRMILTPLDSHWKMEFAAWLIIIFEEVCLYQRKKFCINSRKAFCNCFCIFKFSYLYAVLQVTWPLKMKICKPYFVYSFTQIKRLDDFLMVKYIKCRRKLA